MNKSQSLNLYWLEYRIFYTRATESVVSFIGMLQQHLKEIPPRKKKHLKETTTSL